MKLNDALRLGHANIKAHKGRSIATIITISVLFGLVMGVNFVLQGIQNSLLPYAETVTDGKIYVRGYIRGSNGPETVDKRIEKYHGKKVGTLTEFETYQGSVYYISPEVVQRWITKDIDTVPEDKLAYLVAPEAKKCLEQDGEDRCYLGQYLTLTEGLGVEVGLLPAERGSLQLGETGQFHPLNLILWDIRSGEMPWVMVVQRPHDWRPEEYEKEKVSVIAEFDNVRDAYRYTQMKDEDEFNYSALQAETAEMFSNQVGIYSGVRSAEKKLRVLEIILIVVAIVIMAFTFAHLIDHNAAMIALYRSIGAMTRDIVWVSLCYLFEMCLFAIGLATIVGSAIAGAVSLLNAAQLRQVAEAYYNIQNGGPVVLIGFNILYLEVVGLMLAGVPVSFLLVCDHLSTKRIAMRLKKD